MLPMVGLSQASDTDTFRSFQKRGQDDHKHLWWRVSKYIEELKAVNFVAKLSILNVSRCPSYAS